MNKSSSSSSSPSSSSDASDSDSGERFRNVRRLLISSNSGGSSGGGSQRDNQARDLDENYAYKRKLGDLIFDAQFEGGNLGAVERVDQFDYDLMCRPDVANPRHRIWFNFSVSNQRPGQCVVFNLVNLSENLPLLSRSPTGLTPVARSRLRPNWIRLSASQVFYYRSLDHGNRHVLSMAFRFDHEQQQQQHDNEYQFALLYPYTITHLTSFISRWSTEFKRSAVESSYKHCSKHGMIAARRQSSLARFEPNIVDHSSLSKPIYEINIAGDQTTADKLAVVVIGQTRGCLEAPISFVCQGLMDFMLSDDSIARAARNHIELCLLPMLDPDSTWVGNGRTDLMGQRHLDAELVAANPHLYASHRLAWNRIERAAATTSRSSSSSASLPHTKFVLVELKMNADLIGARAVGERHKDSLRFERHLHLPRLMSRFSEAFYLENCLFQDEASPLNWGFFHGALRGANSEAEHYQIEVSPLGYHKRTLSSGELEEFTQEKYLLLGKALAYSLLELKRPGYESLPAGVARHLAAFHSNPRDIDDLTLANHSQTH